MKKNLSAIAALGCFLALFEMPDEFYKILRFAVVAACGFIIFDIQKSTATDKAKSWKTIGYGLLAVIFNPILPLEMHQSDWVWFNIAGALIFGWFVFGNKIKAIFPKLIEIFVSFKKLNENIIKKNKFTIILALICVASFFATLQISKYSKEIATIFGVLFFVSLALLTILMWANMECDYLEEKDNEKKRKEFSRKLKELSKCTSIEAQNEMVKNWGTEKSPTLRCREGADIY
jgi:hypothetical protein